MALSACTGLTDAPPRNGANAAPAGPPYPLGSADTCGAAPHVALVGQADTALERVLIMRQVRVIRPGMAVTEDFRPQRINFYIDDAARIAQITCG